MIRNLKKITSLFILFILLSAFIGCSSSKKSSGSSGENNISISPAGSHVVEDNIKASNVNYTHHSGAASGARR